jgi:hypothetical protein
VRKRRDQLSPARVGILDAASFNFISLDGPTKLNPAEWLDSWAKQYHRENKNKYSEDEYCYLVNQNSPFSADYFERLGRWKDNAVSEESGVRTKPASPM